MKKGLAVIIVIWTALLGISFWFNYKGTKEAVRGIAFQTARTFFIQVVLTREWVARRGGVSHPR